LGTLNLITLNFLLMKHPPFITIYKEGCKLIQTTYSH